MADLKIVISALNKASGDLNKVKQDISGVKDAGEKGGTAIQGFGDSLSGMMGKAALVAGVVAGVGLAMKEVYESAKEAAELDYAAARFGNLTESIGTTSDALLTDMKAATKGMVSDADLIASAGDFMALGLAKTHDEVVRLTTVAGALGMNMNQLVLTLTNQTTMRFDALGVSVDGFDAKVKALEESGMSASEAFSEAFLQQAEEQIRKVGSASDYAIGDVKRFEASIENLGNTAKEALIPIANKILPEITEKLDNLNRTQQFNRLRTDIEGFGLSVDGLTAPFETFFGQFIKTDETLVKQMSMFKKWANTTYDGYVKSGMGADEARAKVIELYNTYGIGVFAVQDWADSNYESAAGMAAAQAAAESEAPAIQSVADATNNADAAMRAYSESLLFKIASEGLSEEGALALARAMGLIDQNTVAATEQVNFYQGLLDSGIITQRQYNLLVADLADNIENLPEGKNLEVTTNSEEVLAVLAEIEMRKFKNKSLTVDVDLDTSAVDGYSPPNKYGTITYLPSRGMNQAVGGPVTAGQQYNWQEYGYRGELFVPSSDGFILSRADAERALSRALAGDQSALDPDAIGKAVAKAIANVVSGKSGGGNVYNLTMPTSSNPADVRTAFELMEAWGA
ncbi:MAG: hypothetical protein PHY82_12315 [Lentisphaeria bacterium]|nr:hypothetical protein [Lentisphaeria bacterium]